MTVTISRLYDTYPDAERAVRALEAAGVPHSEISIVANNSDNWYSADKKVDRDRDGVDDRAEGRGPALASVLASAVPPVCWRGLACWPFPDSDRLSRRAGSHRPRSELPRALRPAELSAR